MGPLLILSDYWFKLFPITFLFAPYNSRGRADSCLNCKIDDYILNINFENNVFTWNVIATIYTNIANLHFIHTSPPPPLIHSFNNIMCNFIALRFQKDFLIEKWAYTFYPFASSIKTQLTLILLFISKIKHFVVDMKPKW